MPGDEANVMAAPAGNWPFKLYVRPSPLAYTVRALISLLPESTCSEVVDLNRPLESGPAVEELYDARQDPLEMQNVAANPSLVKELRQKLKEYVDNGWEITKGSFATVLS
jgi:hypothetical protein